MANMTRVTAHDAVSPAKATPMLLAMSLSALTFVGGMALPPTNIFAANLHHFSRTSFNVSPQKFLLFLSFLFLFSIGPIFEKGLQSFGTPPD